MVTWTYDDGNGNITTQTQNVIITAPDATTTLSGLTITAATPAAIYQWINCGTGNTPITGETSQSFTASSNGSYAVIVTQHGCSATSNCVTISTVGLKEFVVWEFALYPNPNNGVFTLEVKDKTEVIVTNVLGRVVLNKVIYNTQLINLQHEAKGLYFIELNKNNQSKILKVIVE